MGPNLDVHNNNGNSQKKQAPIDVAENLSVMLVDEDRKVHVLFDHLFRNSGIQVDHATSALEALPLIHRGYGLVVADLHMPQLDGIELLKRIKQIDSSVEVIIISRDKSESTISSAMQNGAMAYLPKPFKTRATVLRTVRRGLDRWRETKKEEILYNEIISGQKEFLRIGNKKHRMPFSHRDFPVLDLLSLLNDGFVFINIEGRITFANVRFTRKLNLPYKNVFVKDFIKYVLRQDREDFQAFLAQIGSERRTGITETRMVNRHGTIMHMMITCRPISLSENNHGDMVLVVTDISERREAQQRARRLATLVDRARFEAIIVKDENGRILYSNRAAEEMFGYPEGELVGVEIEKLFDDEARDTRLSLLPGESNETEREAIDLAGNRFPVEISRSEETDGAKNASGMIFVRDITRRKKAEEELIAVNERLKRTNAELIELRETQSQFFANMSHELKTPLNTIGGYASLMIDKVGGPVTEKQIEWLTSIKKQSGHLLSLIQEILDFAKLNDSKSIVSFRSVDARAIINDVWAAAIALSRGKNIHIKTNVDASISLMTSDGNRLRQVLMNLVSNAVKFTDEGNVDIVVEPKPEGQVTFSVKDTGIGIASEELPKIFTDFYQIDGSVTRSHRGTGLGLAIVKRLVTCLQGELDVKSEVGKGSAFTIRLPKEPKINPPE